MKTFLNILLRPVLLVLLPAAVVAQIPVTDVANLANNTAEHAENLAKWVESIAQLKTQIDQLHQQIDIQTDLRKWSGNPAEAGGKLLLNALGESELVRDYGRTKAAILSTVNSLDSLSHTGGGNYRAIASVDLAGNPLSRDPLAYRRYAALDATQASADQATEDTRAREKELQAEIAVTMEDLKAAPTEAETQKISAKLAALNGQLVQADAARRREVDAVILQKTANDSRLEEERIAAAELAAKNNFLANERISTYMKTIHVRRTPPDAK
ncbi:MAG TPA: type IV secretion system protein [Opitutaceae bacterium]|nr:type IV secretion system protein [Opitutaceae bacterium]